MLFRSPSAGGTVTGVDFYVALDNARRLSAERGVEVEWVQADVREPWVPNRARSTSS